MRNRIPGFTMIELLVALAIIATLLTLAAPRYLGGITKAQDDVLRENLYSLRQAIDHYYADRGKYPKELADLVTDKYLRKIPVDPVTSSNVSWVVIPPDNPALGGVFDIKSSAPGKGLDGTYYQTW
ncbi:type II secretion system GspH family protein [Burkholderiaceae bacterium DAT-1]|nr:type II secretion system GspH family protein [Burkholderiaceae bacterium DAT-1]